MVFSFTNSVTSHVHAQSAYPTGEHRSIGCMSSHRNGDFPRAPGPVLAPSAWISWNARSAGGVATGLLPGSQRPGSEAWRSLPSCVTEGEFLTSAEPQTPHLQEKGDLRAMAVLRTRR